MKSYVLQMESEMTAIKNATETNTRVIRNAAPSSVRDAQNTLTAQKRYANKCDRYNKFGHDVRDRGYLRHLMHKHNGSADTMYMLNGDANIRVPPYVHA